MKPPPLDERTRITFFWDRIRGCAGGFLEATFQTFVLLTAIRVFEAPTFVKATLPAAFPIGFLLVPMTVYVAARIQRRVGSICAGYAVFCAIALALAVGANALWVYVACILAAQIILSQVVPLVTQIYASNYSPKELGSRFSTTFLISTSMAALVSYTGGKLLDYDLSYYIGIFVCASLASLVVALAFLKMPTDALKSISKGNPWQSVVLLKKDKLFAWMLGAWMIMGLGSFMTFPIRIEYMANPAYGINATNEQIGLIFGAIPLITRLLSTKFWGYLFDRLNLISLRIILNLLMMVSHLLYFSTTNLWLMGIAAGILGLSFGGGRIMWQLWVIKISPPHKTADYMSVHSAFTGIRGLLAPFLGYILLQWAGPVFVGWMAAALVGIATIFFLPTRVLVDARSRNLPT